jgi:hypothetical protein
MKLALASLSAASLLWLGGCGEKVSATVNCVTVDGPAVRCAVQQTLGRSEVEVCWDFAVECANGTRVVPPRSCTRVKDGGSSSYVIGADKLAGAERCDKDPRATVSNVSAARPRS